VRNLSIKLYRIYACYTNITVYVAFGIIRWFHVTAVGLGMYHPSIRGPTCISHQPYEDKLKHDIVKLNDIH